MCGICGIVSRGPGEVERVRRMTDLLAHRGPDDEAFHAGPMVALGHRRLSIIDLEGGRQPISNEDGTIQIVFNGEIYNYQELRPGLIERGHHLRTSSDTEVIVHLYEELGVDCLTKLRGMFAFALWDAKKQRLFCARDHLGQKPFYYALAGGELRFASEIKALTGTDPSLRTVDFSALDQYLSLRLIAPPKSMFQNVRKLPPAHYLTFGFEEGLRVERYWDLSYEPKHEGSDEALTDALEAQIIESLKLHLVSDVPVGAFMSGGLDSTLVVAMIASHGLAGRLQTFSMGLDHGAYNEAPAAKLVAERYGTDHREEMVHPTLVKLLPKLIYHLDEPSDPLSLCSYLVAKMARPHVKVVLGGDGGDELFGGYDRYYGNRYAEQYALIPGALRRYALAPILRRVPDGNWYKSKTHQLRWLNELSFHSGGERYARSLSYFYFDGALKRELYGPCMRDAAGSFDATAPIREAYDGADARDSVDRMLRADSFIRMPDHPVMILDRMTMAHGLEARSPFMDHRLAEFAAHLPARLKVRGRSLRYVQTLLAKRYLPAEVLARRKQGFSSALPYMLREEFRGLFRSYLTASHLVRDGYFERKPIATLLDQHLGGQRDHGNRLWLLLNAELWYRMALENVSERDLSSELETSTLARVGAGAAG